MPTINIYLPDILYNKLKKHNNYSSIVQKLLTEYFNKEKGEQQ